MERDRQKGSQGEGRAPPVVLVDGTYHLFRSYHALPPLRTSGGEATWAVLGCLNVVDKLLRRHRPAAVAVAFDAGGENFRNKLLPEYKANRPPAPPELISQLERAKQVMLARGLTVICEPGVEADDVIASLARQAGRAGLDAIISSSDKDLMQLVDSRVTVEDHKGTLFDAKMVQEKFAVPPSAIVDYLCLVGDQSDNIPGVEKVGPKTAAAWLREYGSLQRLMDMADQVGGKAGENLRLALPRLRLNRSLIQLRDDLELPPVEGMRPGKADVGRLRELYRELEFRSLERKLEADAGAAGDAGADAAEAGGNGGAAAEGAARGATQVSLVKDMAALERLAAELRRHEGFAIYLLLPAPRIRNVQAVGLGLAGDDGGERWAACIPLQQHRLEAQRQLSAAEACKLLEPALRDSAIAKVTWDMKQLMHFMAENGAGAPENCQDVMLQSYLLDSSGAPHSLAKLAKGLPGPTPRELEELCGKGRDRQPLESLPETTVAEQAGACALACLGLRRDYDRRLRGEGMQRLRSVLEDIDLPLAPVLARMERNGVRVDLEQLHQQSLGLEKRLREIEAEAREAAGASFNLDSPAQIRQILFSELKLPALRKTPQGKPSTAEDVLEELDAEDHSPLPGIILRYRGLSKLKSTYTDSLPNSVNRDSGRVHATYQQAAVATGRLAAINPNLQNIPVRTPEGRKIRAAFIADPGCRLMAADYAQIELRIMACLSGDSALLEAFRDNRDVHDETAAGVFGLAAGQKPDREQRRMAKIINFGLMYGMSAFSLGRRLKIPRDEAEAYVSNYFSRYPGVLAFMEECRETAKDKGFVETVCGRRVTLPAIRSRQAAPRGHAERAAINAPLQGTAADIVRRAMVRIDDWIASAQPRVRMIMQVHDELVLEVPEELVEQSREAVRECMASACPELELPLDVNIGLGHDWEQAH